MSKDYSAAALAKFLDYTADKGLMKRETALSRKRAAEKILSALEENEVQDLRNVDLEDASQRFINKQGTDYKPESLRVYSSRLKSAVSDFLSYVENPSSFKSSVVTRNRRKKSQEDTGENATSKDTSQVGNGESASNSKGESNNGDPHDPSVFTVPVPIRSGIVVKISGIPGDLTKVESEKIANVVKAYAVIEDTK